VLLGKHAKLIASSLSTHPLLAQFLQSNDNQYLSWLHDIQLNNYRQVTLISTLHMCTSTADIVWLFYSVNRLWKTWNCVGISQLSEKCQKMDQQSRKCQGNISSEKLFIANFTFAAMSVFSNIMHECFL